MERFPGPCPTDFAAGMDYRVRVHQGVVQAYSHGDFTIQPATVAISGSAGVAAAVLSYTDGTAKTSTADESGDYSFDVTYNWSGTVTPTLAGYTFTPASTDYSNLTTDQTDQDYTASIVQVAISGNVNDGTNPLSGVEMQVSTGGSVTTDASGNYSFAQNYGWSGTVTPVLAGYAFAPANRTYSAVQADTPGQDYTAAVKHIQYFRNSHAG